MHRNPTTAALSTCLLLLAPAVASAAEAFAVLPLAEGPGPDEAVVRLAGELRRALDARDVIALPPDALRDRMAGNASAAALVQSDAAYQAALDQHARGDFEGSIRALRAVIADLELLPGGAEVRARRQRSMLRLARSEQAVGRRGEAQAVLQRLLSIDPAVEVDPRLYPPGFQRLVEEVRAETRALWTRRLTVEAQPGVKVFLEGREVGPAPASLDLPPGRYRVSGALGAIRSREALADLTGDDRRIVLDLSVAELLRPDRGPGLAMPPGERASRTPAVARFLDLDRVVVVWTGAEVEHVPPPGARAPPDDQPGLPYLAASLHDARRGTSSQEARVTLVDGKLPPGAAEALAAQLLSGEESSMVKVVAEPDLRPVLPPLDAPRRGWLAWDGVKRPAAKKWGWMATAGMVAATALTVLSVEQFGEAESSYEDARGMLDHGQVAYGHTLADYNGAISRGDRARQTATISAAGAGAFVVGSLVMGLVSYHQTGEVGPIRF